MCCLAARCPYNINPLHPPLGAKEEYIVPFELECAKLPLVDPFKPEYTIVIFIHYKPRIVVAIPDL